MSGTTRVTPPMMMNAWIPRIVVSPVASSFSNVRSARIGDAQPGADDQEVGDQHGGRAEQPELLADRRRR